MRSNSRIWKWASYFAFCIFSLLGTGAASASISLTADGFDLYKLDLDADGKKDIYFKARKSIVLIAGDINIPISIYTSSSFMMSGQDLAIQEWSHDVNVSESLLVDYELQQGDFDNDGSKDILILDYFGISGTHFAIFGGASKATVSYSPRIASIPSSVTTAEDTPATIDIFFQDSDTPHSGLVYSVTSSDLNLIPESAFSHSFHTDSHSQLTFYPAKDVSGEASIIISVSDGATTDTREVQVVVTPVNDPPVFNGFENIELPVGEPISKVLGSVVADLAPLSLDFATTNYLVLKTDELGASGGSFSKDLRLDKVFSHPGKVTFTVKAVSGDVESKKSFVVDVISDIADTEVSGFDPSKYRVFVGDKSISSPSGRPTIAPVIYLLGMDDSVPSYESEDYVYTYRAAEDITELRSPDFDKAILESFTELEHGSTYFTGDFNGDGQTDLFTLSEATFYNNIFVWDSSSPPGTGDDRTIEDEWLDYEVVIRDNNGDDLDDVNIYSFGELIAAYSTESDSGLIYLDELQDLPAYPFDRIVDGCEYYLTKTCSDESVADNLSCLESNARVMRQFCIVRNTEVLEYNFITEDLTEVLKHKYGSSSEYRSSLVDTNASLVRLLNSNSELESDLQIIVSKISSFISEDVLAVSLASYEADITNVVLQANTSNTTEEINQQLLNLDTVLSAELARLNDLMAELESYIQEYENIKIAYAELVYAESELIVSLDARTEALSSTTNILNLAKGYLRQRKGLISNNTQSAREDLESKRKVLLNQNESGEVDQSIQTQAYASNAHEFTGHIQTLIDSASVGELSSVLALEYQSPRFAKIAKLDQLLSFCSSSGLNAWQDDGCQLAIHFDSHIKAAIHSEVAVEINNGIQQFEASGDSSLSPELKTLVSTRLSQGDIVEAAIYYDLLLKKLETTLDVKE